mgnify:CR=1 FL=1
MTTDPLEPEILTTVRSEVEAAMIIADLEERGIEASMGGGDPAGIPVEGTTHVDIVVRQDHLEAARKAYAEIQEEKSHIDWSQVDVGKPEE